MSQIPPPDDPMQVLAGTLPTGHHWKVVVHGDREHLHQMLNVYDGDRMVAGKGFDGPALYDGSLLNEYRGRTDGLPWFVMARTAPDIDRVVATTDRGSEVALALSPVVAPWRLRFAVAALPDGEGPGSIRVEANGEILETRRQ